MNSDLKCAACHVDFDNTNNIPKILPCQHTYCPRSLSELVRGPSSIDCNICRVNHNLRIEAVPVNQMVMQRLGGSQNPGFPGQNPGYPPQNQGFPGQNPGYPPQGSNVPNIIPGIINPPQSSNVPNMIPQNTSQSWDERSYFKTLFDEMDHNHDGEISGQELHMALRKGQSNSEFDPHTVGELMKKYDSSRNGEINFNEFYQLFTDINGMFNEFLDVDLDFSGSIDNRELSNSLRRKGYNFSQGFYDFLFFELSKMTGKQQISFDIYVRVITKMGKLRFDFKNMPQNRNNPNVNPGQFEQFVRQYFFH